VWTLSYLGAQLAAGPVVLLAWMGARRARREREGRPQVWRAGLYLICVAAPLLVFYLAVSFVANTQWNWTIAAYVTLCVLGAWGIGGRGLGLPSTAGLADSATPSASAEGDRSSWLAGSAAAYVWRATWIIGLMVGLGTLRLDLLALLPVVGRYVPVGRFTGAERMGEHMDRLAAEVGSAAGRELFFMAQHYGRAAQLAFYMKGHPTVYCTSSLMLDGRLTPQDFWAQTDLRRATGLVGRPAIVVGNTAADWAPLFDRVEEVGTLEGDGKKDRPAFKAYNFHGFPPGGLRSPGAPELQNP
jgi:hypothetical protein